MSSFIWSAGYCTLNAGVNNQIITSKCILWKKVGHITVTSKNYLLKCEEWYCTSLLEDINIANLRYTYSRQLASNLDWIEAWMSVHGRYKWASSTTLAWGKIKRG